MKNHILKFALCFIVVSCGGGAETATENEAVEKEEGLSPSEENAAKTNFGFAMAEFGVYKANVNLAVAEYSDLGYASDEAFDGVVNQQKIVEEKLDYIINEFEGSVYVDSAKIFIDSVKAYRDKFDEAHKTAQK